MNRRHVVPLVILVTSLLAIVAFAAGGRPLGGSAETSSGLPMVFWDYAFTTVVIVAFIGLVATVLAYALMGHDRSRERQPFQRRTATTLAILFVALILISLLGPRIQALLQQRHNRHAVTTTNTTPVATTSTLTLPSTPTGQQRRDRPHGVHFQWPELAVILGVLLVLGVVVAGRSRLRSALKGREGAPEALAAALDESLDDLRTEPDLRRAIVAAYARMEAALGAAGLPRRPAEAPLEYVERALRALDTSAASVRRLTDLFEWARFSHHEPEPAMKDEAIDALVAVRDELRDADRVRA